MSKQVKVALFVIIDVVAIALSWLLALLILPIGSLGQALADNYYFIIISVAFAVLVCWLLKLYKTIWKYAGFYDALKVICACICIASVNVICCIFSNNLGIAHGVVTSCFSGIFLIISRFALRCYNYIVNRGRSRGGKSSVARVMIIGGGSAGALMIREMQTSAKITMYPVCILDDNPAKIGQDIYGVKIVGATDQVEKFVKIYKPETILIAIPSANKSQVRKIYEQCKKTSLKVLMLPGLYQLAQGKVSIARAKEVDIKDLLGREQVKVNLDEIMGYIENKVVLVTGGGGSIGSELCRQIATHKPKQLIIIDIYENNAYEIQQELLRNDKDLNLLVLIASVRDSKKMNDVFAKYKPQIVFHAAAHKHVPLMETSPNEAVKNNVSGTIKVADAAGRNGAERFILISTDKAVRPTNIMGATKRICEMIVQALNEKYDTDYVAVRFGNVLGSNGSVIPLFKKQIDEGGPVTVTHKDMVRYFMTIPEAVSLVLQAGAFAKGGEIFVLDMGEPVKIYDLAVNMIELSGYEPNKDIEIKITGLRPGEKLYEERLMEEEGLQKTANDMISIGQPIAFDKEKFLNKIQELYVEAYNETERMKELVHELVPTYTIDKRQ